MMRTLSKSEYVELLASSDVIEKDRHGVKVVRLSDGNFLKTFWYRHRISSRRLYSEWLRFVLHAGSLKRRSIPTVEIVETIRIPHLCRTAVIYRPLAGQTLRHVAKEGSFDAELVTRLGVFIAGLHRKGIHFHSLHLGNVLLCPDGTLGLIDIANMRVFLWPLQDATRLRNFIHLFRYPQDFKTLSDAGIQAFVDGYFQHRASPKLRSRLQALCLSWETK